MQVVIRPIVFLPGGVSYCETHPRITSLFCDSRPSGLGAVLLVVAAVVGCLVVETQVEIVDRCIL